MKQVVIILPTYNEKDNIGQLIDQIESVIKKLKKFKFKLLVVDDNSPDGTEQIVRRYQKKYSHISMITGKKEGLGKALIRGMDHAIKKLKADILIQMDADLSHNPQKIPLMLQQINRGYDIVIGARYIPGGSIPKNWGLHRKILSISGNTLVRLVLMNFSIHDWTSGYRAIKSWIFPKIKAEIKDFTGYTFQVAFLNKASTKEAKITEIPIHFVDRRYGKSKIGPEYVKNLIAYLAKETIKNPPRFIKFLLVGSIGFLVQFLSFRLFRSFSLRPSIATALSAEIAIISNFTWNNLWTFAERKITQINLLISKFVQFNLTSLGSILIQAGVSEAGSRLFGIKPLFSPMNFTINSDDLYLVVGVIIGLIWNYTMYSLVIWKKSKK
jgi:dolichol-phosphate mannosyltransferase